MDLDVSCAAGRELVDALALPGYVAVVEARPRRARARRRHKSRLRGRREGIASRVRSPGTDRDRPGVDLARSPDDFVINLRTIEKKCFGSAGCNVTVSIDPTYVGSGAIPDAFKVTYEIRGGEDGPEISTFSVEGDTVSYDGEERISTSSSDAELEAVATEVWS